MDTAYNYVTAGVELNYIVEPLISYWFTSAAVAAALLLSAELFIWRPPAYDLRRPIEAALAAVLVAAAFRPWLYAWIVVVQFVFLSGVTIRGASGYTWHSVTAIVLFKMINYAVTAADATVEMPAWPRYWCMATDAINCATALWKWRCAKLNRLSHQTLFFVLIAAWVVVRIVSPGIVILVPAFGASAGIQVLLGLVLSHLLFWARDQNVKVD
jgi:hypothetical protein